MRNLWIAGGIVAALLTLAVISRPRVVAGKGVAAGSQAASFLGSVGDVPAGADAGAEIPPLTGPAGLEADDLSRILELRAEIGSPLDHLGGEKVSRAAFERELRQVAGLESPSVPDEASENVGVEAAASTNELDSPTRTGLRQAAAGLDELAFAAEGREDYSLADSLREIAGRVRRLTRPMNAPSGPPGQNSDVSAGEVAGRLIDNAPTSQAE